MSIIHIAFYPSDWLAGTRGLSAEETGVYITLIARMYEMAGPIERDDNRLYRLCGCKSKASFVKALNYLMAEGKIIESEGAIFNERVQKEIQKTTEKSSKAKAAAQSRWGRKANKNNGSDHANASPEHMPKPCQSEPESEKEPEGSQKKRATRLSDQWVLPKDWGDWAIAEGLDEVSTRRESEKFRDYWIGVGGSKGAKRDWLATWRNWVRRSIEARPKPSQHQSRKPHWQIMQEQAKQAQT